MKRNIISLALAAALTAALAGCTFSTPATVGRIGEVEIPAGIYLLTQYNAYSTAASAATLEDGQTTGDVKAVLAAEATGTIGDEEVTASGKEYLAKLTLRDLEYYAAVETTFADMGGTLDEDALAQAQANADSLWDSNGELYAANGIGKESLQSYLATAQKAQDLLKMQYGDDGLTPVTDAEYESYLQEQCRYVESVEFPMFDYTTYTLADDDQTAEIKAVAQECADALNDEELPVTTSSLTINAVTPIAQQYLTDAMAAMDVAFAPEDTPYYITSQLLLDSDLDSYADGEGGNRLTDALDAANGGWTVVDLTTSVLVARAVDPLEAGKLADYKTSYSLLNALKGEELQARLYADGAALAHDLDQGAMDTYKAANIKRSL